MPPESTVPCLDEDQVDIDALREKYEPMLMRFAINLCGNPHDAEDLVQDLWRQVASTQSCPQAGAEQAWLMKSLRHRWIDLGRYRMRRPVTLFNDLETRSNDEDERSPDPGVSREPQPEVRCFQRERTTALRECLDKLQELQRRFLMLHFFEALPHIEIADHCDAPLGTVAATIHRAKVRIKECMERKGWT